MSGAEKIPFHQKHGPGMKVNQRIKGEIEKHLKNNQLPCAIAFDIADRLKVTPQEVGITLDLLDCRLIKCQLGLFGYPSGEKKVKNLPRIHPNLKNAIEAALIDSRLSCKSAWQIAQNCNVGKMTVSSACETLGIKIKPCQLGAF